MRLLVVGLVFALGSIIAALAGAFASGGLTPGVGIMALLIGSVSAAWGWRSTSDGPPPVFGIWDLLVLAAFALASLRAFLWLAYHKGDALCVLSPNNLGDLSLHLNFIRYFASGITFWPENPILSGVPLSYPLGVDLFNSILEGIGVPTLPGLVWVGLFGATLTGYALWRWGGAFGVAALLCNGGLAGFAVLKTFSVMDFQKDLIWKNFFLAMFVTQRGLLFALPAGLLLLLVWRERHFRSHKLLIPFWVQLLLYASLPLLSLHTFLFLSLILLAIFVSEKPSRPELLRFVGSAFLPASIAVFLVTGQFSASTGLRWLPGGLISEGGVRAWIWDFGITLPLCLILAVLLIRSRNREARCLAGSSLGLFAIACVVGFAPWQWDNMKIILWCWLVIAPSLWSLLIAPLMAPARWALCGLLFFSGAVSLVGGLDGRHGYPIASRSELDAWRVAVAEIPREDRFAAAPDFAHPLILLGRKVVCGYEGHLWSHGLDYKYKLELLKDALNGQAPWFLAAPKLDAQWLGLRQIDVPPALAPEAIPPDSVASLYDLQHLAPRQIPPARPLSMRPIPNQK